jgi:hypothetical protein
MIEEYTNEYLLSIVTVTDQGHRISLSAHGQTMFPPVEAEKMADSFHKDTGQAVYLIKEGSRKITNTKTGETGILVKHCKKTVKVCCKHPTIKGAHAYKFWSTIEG